MNAQLKRIVDQAEMDALCESICKSSLVDKNKEFADRIERLEWVIYELTQENKILYGDAKLNEVWGDCDKHFISASRRKIMQNEKVIFQLGETIKELLTKAMENQKEIDG